ncbi:RTA1 like protein-domain-containing protein [Xylariales sp. AK1849]|nr:RTA1 like protein-domain-containing protein [Xylariales sp. AK1849]
MNHIATTGANHTAQTLSSCTFETCPISSSLYGYWPNQNVNTVFLISFASSLIGFGLITFFTRQWMAFSIPLSLACLFEVLGYAVRAGSSANPWDVHLYVVTELFLTIAPSCISMGIYLTMENTLSVIGNEHSVIDPKYYARFTYVNHVAFCIQAIGLCISIWNILASSGVGHNADKGGYVIAAGIGLQALTLGLFLILYTVILLSAYLAYREFGYTTFCAGRGGRKVLSCRFKIFLAVVLIAAICLLTRDLFRIIGFADGFDGGNRNEWSFALFDGLLISEAVMGLVVFHPAYVFTDYAKADRGGQAGALSLTSSGSFAERQVVV